MAKSSPSKPDSLVADSPIIWIVAPSPPPYGGMSVQAEKLFERLKSEGLSVGFIPTNPALPKSVRLLGKVPVVRTAIRELRYLISLGQVVQDPGVIHHFSASYLYFFLHSVPLLLLGKYGSCRVVLNYRGGRAKDFLAQYFRIIVPLIKCAHEVVVPSEFLRSIFQQFGVAATVVPNFADVEYFPFTRRDCFSPALFVSRNLEPIYDIETVLRAFKVVQSSTPHARLGVAGHGSEAHRLRRMAEQWKLRNVEFFGEVPYRTLPDLYRKYDIYVNASRVDNFPGALVEAACAGLPIVTTRVGGIGEMIRDGETGLLCAPGDFNGLANRVLELLQQQRRAVQLAQNARDWAEKLAWATVFPQLLRAYGLAPQTQNQPLSRRDSLRSASLTAASGLESTSI